MSAPESRPAVDVAAPITDSGPMLEENKIYGLGDVPGGGVPCDGVRANWNG